MIDLSPGALVSALNAGPPEMVWLLLLAVCFGSVVCLHRLFGAAGLYVWIAVAIIGANVQVMKPVAFSVFPDPVALGTVLFASLFLATDLLAEMEGPAAARRGVLLGFAAYLLWTVLMVLTLGFSPLDEAAAGEGLAWALDVHPAMATLFMPAPAFLVAGMAAYMVSQFHDIWLYDAIRRLTGGRRLWLRNTLSTAVSALIDTIVFSVLAWVVFAPEPLDWQTLVVTYILGTYVLRLAVAVLDTPFIYLARHWGRPPVPAAA